MQPSSTYNGVSFALLGLSSLLKVLPFAEEVPLPTLRLPHSKAHFPWMQISIEVGQHGLAMLGKRISLSPQP